MNERGRTGRTGRKSRQAQSDELSPTLRSLVKVVEAALGEVIAEGEGRALFETVEAVRRSMVTVRTGGARAADRALGEAQERLRALSAKERAAVARAYTVYLELVNLCENAYRTHRLRSRWREAGSADERLQEPGRDEARADVVFVLTAHPTESRSPKNIQLMRRGQALLLAALERREVPDREALKHLLHLVWQAGTHPPHKPTVEDEARHLFSLVDDPILAELLRMRRRGHSVRLRTWVGGDKDGHPGVGPEETDASLNLSRARLLGFVEARLLPEIAGDVALLGGAELRVSWERLQEALAALRRVAIGDGRRIALLREALDGLGRSYQAARGAGHPQLRSFEDLLELFPGLVIPLELREERGLLGRRSVIADMLHTLADVARGGKVGDYVRGLVVSMTDAAEDLLAAQALVEEVLGGPALPVVPLFEMPDVLPRATEILEGALADPRFRAGLAAWGDRVEVMLGYSDTSKRMGVLPSRQAILAAMREISSWAEARGLDVLFFHGSGGSVGRGGGRIEDRVATWPPAACRVFKETLQGEMVERTLATPEILRSLVAKVAQVQASPPPPRRPSAATEDLARRAQEVYVQVVSDPDFHELLARATPYGRLGALNIGSRPVSRKASAKPTGLEALRAIPWVLCWTQTRFMLPGWLGIGSAWRAVRRDPKRKAALLRALREDPLLRSYVRLLGFTLAKSAPRIWEEYVHTLIGGEAPPIVQRLAREWQDALDFARQGSPDGELLSDRPWLRESIYYRAPMIHPLNLLQIDVLARKRLSEADELLFRETVTGIAAGMLTTG